MIKKLFHFNQHHLTSILLVIGLSVIGNQIIIINKEARRNHYLIKALRQAKTQSKRQAQNQQWWKKNKWLYGMWQSSDNQQLKSILHHAHGLKLEQIIKRHRDHSASINQNIQISWSGSFKQTLIYLRHLSKTSNPWPIQSIIWSHQTNHPITLTIKLEVPHVD